jgi:hypothetical protein
MRAANFLRLKCLSRPPATGTAMQLAFDETWDSISAGYGNDPETVAAARMRLAECVSIVTLDKSTDVDEIKRMALHMLRIIEL